MKKRITIYIEEGVWEKIKFLAWGEKKSASRWLEDLVREGDSPVPGGIMEEIKSSGNVEHEGDPVAADFVTADGDLKVIVTGGTSGTPATFQDINGDRLRQKLDKDNKAIADAQKHLDEIRKRNGVKGNSWYGGSHSKARQLGKK